MACVLGLGLMAAFFSPIKYGILPDHLKLEELPAGNALIEGGTFLSILLGVIAGGFAPAAVDTSVIAGFMVLVAVGCWASADLHPARPARRRRPCAIDPNILRSTRDLLRALRADRRLTGGAIAVSLVLACRRRRPVARPAARP